MTFVGSGKDLIASRMSLQGCTPSPETTWPRYFSLERKKSHLARFIKILCSFSAAKILRRCTQCSSIESEYTIMSSSMTMANLFRKGCNTLVMTRIAWPGALVRPKGTTFQWKWPRGVDMPDL